MLDLKKELSSAKLTREQLCEIVAAALREAQPELTVKVRQPNEIEILRNNREPTTFYVDNLWLECRGEAAEARMDIFQRYVRAFLSTLEVEVEEFRRDMIVPTIKDSEYFAIMKDSSNLLREHLVADLWILYAIDYPESISSLLPKQAEKLGIQKDELRKLAIENLRRVLPEIEQHGSGPWYLLTAGDYYVASLLLLDDLWKEMEQCVEGDVVAVVPSRDVLLFTGSRSKEGLQQIRARAHDISGSGGHLVSETLIRRTSGEWKVFD